MLRDKRLMEDFEREFVSSQKLSFAQASRLFESMWQEAVRLGVLPPRDPMEGIEKAVRIAKALSSCSRNSSPG